MDLAVQIVGTHHVAVTDMSVNDFSHSRRPALFVSFTQFLTPPYGQRGRENDDVYDSSRLNAEVSKNAVLVIRSAPPGASSQVCTTVGDRNTFEAD